ncbi:MAG: Rho termination factor N-terminal domain-containing protein [Actinomycetota bacterium]|nr:Rho termination factor N-terminal domain-containing protein [Actinomycetota bacterium]
MSVLDRSALEASPLADLHTIASELSIDGYRRLRRAELIGVIIDKQSGGGGAAVDASAKDVPAEKPKPRRATRARRTSRAAADEDDEAGDAKAETDAKPEKKPTARGAKKADANAEQTADAKTDARADAKAEPAAGADRDDHDDDDDDDTSSRRRRGRRGGRGGRGTGRDEASSSTDGDDDSLSARDTDGDRGPGDADGGEEPSIEGVVELLAGGSGFVRVDPPEPSDEDVYISAAQVKRCELVSGDRVSGPKRAPRRSERFASLIRIETINGRPASELADSVRYDELPAAFPADRIKLGSEDPTVKAIEFLTPFGKGSRVTIVGPARAGKTEALKRIAAALGAEDGMTVSLVLAGARPEEITEWSQGPHPPAAAVALGASEEVVNGALEPVIDQARRLTARGADAIVLIDSLDACSSQVARRALGSARNIVDGGSLTLIATASAPIGGETTVIALNLESAATGRFPALDLIASGVLRPELLVGQAGADAIAATRVEAAESDPRDQ